MKESYTRQLAKFACNARFEDIPSDVIQHLKLWILDDLGCGIYGSTMEWGIILSDYIHSFDKNEECTIWGTQFRSTASNAALVNATMVHGLDLDSTHPHVQSHLGSVAFTSALALAEHKGGINGKDFLTAVAIGYELFIRLAVCCGITLFRRGFYPTGACGPIGSAAAAAKLLESNEEEMLNTFGISTSFHSGFSPAHLTMVKRLFVGKAAESGVIAAQLASKGFTGIKDILDEESGVFCKALCDDYNLSTLTDGLGEEYEIRNVEFKDYPCVGTIPTALDAVGEIQHEHSFDVESIKKVSIKISNFAKEHTGWKYNPESIIAAQRNMYYCVATRLIEGDFFVDQLSPKKLTDPKLLRLIDLIDISADSELETLTAVVEVDLKSGERFSRRVDHHKPMTYEDIKKKFKRLALKRIDSNKATSVIAMVERLEDVKDLRELSQLLVP